MNLHETFVRLYGKSFVPSEVIRECTRERLEKIADYLLVGIDTLNAVVWKRAHGIGEERPLTSVEIAKQGAVKACSPKSVFACIDRVNEQLCSNYRPTAFKEAMLQDHTPMEGTRRYAFTLGLNTRALRRLQAEDVATVEHLLKRGELNLRKSPDLGSVTLEHIKERLKANGYHLPWYES